MKTLVSKTLFALFLFLTLGFLFSSNVLAMVQSNNADKGNKNATIEDKKADQAQNIIDRVCQKIEKAYSKIVEKGQGLENRIDAKREQKEAAYTKRVEEKNQERVALRAKVDENFAANLEKLMTRAETEEQKKAVSQFQKTVEAARTLRRATIDKANETFRTEVKNQIRLREENLSGSTETFKASVQAAFDSAQASCEKGTDIKAVRDAFKDSLKTAREKLQNENQNRERIGENVSAAAKVRNEIQEKANQAFKTTLGKAIQDLNVYFSDSSTE